MAVRIHMASNAKLHIRERIAALGGEVETVSGEVICASLPANALARLAISKGIRLIEPQATFGAQANINANANAESPSENIQARMLATLATLHDQGMRGKGVRVGVLDFSFAGYSAPQAARQVPRCLPSARLRASNLWFRVRKTASGMVLNAPASSTRLHRMPNSYWPLQTVLEPGYYFLGVRATRLFGKGVAHLFVSGAKRMTPVVEAGSVSSPGTAKMAITVGAANALSMPVENYSGRGPTVDGRRKPELLASGEGFKLEGATRFRGTSAAAPVVSGLAALIATPALTPLASKSAIASAAALRERLQQLARALPGDKPDQSAAWGMLAPEFLLIRR